MKRIVKVIIVILFTLFSFYYTDKIISFSKNKDPIMQEIIKYDTNHKIDSINGTITKDTLLVGTSGKKIDYEASYANMKVINSFNKNLLEYVSVLPLINKNNNLDKVIVGKNTNEKEISFVFTIDNIYYLDQIIYILNTNNISSTFYIDKDLVDTNIVYLKNNLGKSNIGFYNLDETDILYLKNLYKKNSIKYTNYCLYKNDDYMDICTKFKYSTIRPIVIEKNLYNYIKNSKEKGYIYNIKVNSLNIRELNSTIIYLKSKDYKIVNINTLLKE